jgi:ribonuclease VapC
MKKVIDTETILAFYLNELGAEKMEDLFRKTLECSEECFLNIVNLTEFYYIIPRKSKRATDEKEKNLRSYGVRIVPVVYDCIWKEAARIKSSHSLSLADAFAAATAKTLKADLVAGFDTEFHGIGIRIEKIR